MVIKEILNRRAVRNYKQDPIPQEYITEIIKAGQFAPTARNNRAVEFVVVREQETKNKIFDAMSGESPQPFIKEAPVLIIPASDTSKSGLSIQDLSNASENMFLQARALGLGTVWKHLEEDWVRGVKKVLGIPEQYMIINIIPVGYPKEEMPPHTDADFSAERIHEEKW